MLEQKFEYERHAVTVGAITTVQGFCEWSYVIGEVGAVGGGGSTGVGQGDEAAMLTEATRAAKFHIDQIKGRDQSQ